ncbi:NUDIX hydrolase [Planococcus sp. CAU13]|uniref:NUDIX hydrolase n=1 Tax=Planococcus sp. CAU13 TaxID=1541197 RepID=UPI00068DEBBA|nr:NUDIX domain-containing protein [Planococcus sp. CAU13]
MYFKKTFSFIDNSATPTNIIRRTAVRAIIIEKTKILMVRSNFGYYKLPGGGVEFGESHAEALAREVAEETGYLYCSVGEEVGIISEQRPDYSMKESYFHMNSYHYICTLENKDKDEQSLIGYELEEGYTPVWISLEEAVDTNNEVYRTDKSHLFILRENFVLEWLLIHNYSVNK